VEIEALGALIERRHRSRGSRRAPWRRLAPRRAADQLGAAQRITRPRQRPRPRGGGATTGRLARLALARAVDARPTAPRRPTSSGELLSPRCTT
jgi:hypothetical protein